MKSKYNKVIEWRKNEEGTKFPSSLKELAIEILKYERKEKIAKLNWPKNNLIKND